MKASPLATPLVRLPLMISLLSAGITLAQPFVPQAGSGLSAYPPGAVQPPAYQMPVAPTPPTPPPGPPPPGFNVPNYRPPGLQPAPGSRPTAAPTKKSTSKSSPTKSKAATTTKSSYRPATGGSTAKAKTPTSNSSLESRVGKLESNDHRQDLRLGRLERDVGLLPSSIEGGGMADIIPTGKTHIVRPGDTLFNVASRYNTSVGELRSLNHLSSETLDIGETLLIPDGQTWSQKPTQSTAIHVVSGDESLAGIARSYGVSEDAIARANPSIYPSDLRPGERLTIPNPRRMPGTGTIRQNNGGGGTTVVSSNVTHTVKKGEMLGRIASKHGVSLSKLMSANGIKNPNKIVIGQRLLIPGKKSTRTITDPNHDEPETQPLPHMRLVETDPEPMAEPIKPTPPAPPLPPIEPKLNKPTMPRGIVAYRMQPGDSIDSVANLFGTTEANIRAINQFSADKKLKEGDELFVPTVGAVSVN